MELKPYMIVRPEQKSFYRPVKIMKAVFSLGVILLFSTAYCVAQDSQAKIVKLPELLSEIKSPSDDIKVFNFWATWCGPCIKELPLLERVNAERDDVEVILVSMDLDLDPDPTKVHKFVNRKKLRSTVIILDETNPNAWIDKIEKQWSGALPATLVVNTKTGQRKFIEKELGDGELDVIIDSLK